ncbi:hypothetical protein [uncultured Serinicoccus sp.]|uniref:hypothetical protein n=1 Tax=uncultured Serinicoccus sp. TaxID=735514 RepID=UPI002632499C|nr:hypothetical protein [uncultured Serinicoccus sp.]
MLEAVWPPICGLSFGGRKVVPSQTGETYLCLPMTSAPTVFVPRGPRAVTAAALRGYKSPSTRRAQLTSVGLGVAGWLGAARLVPTTFHVQHPEHGLPAHLSEATGRPSHTGVTLGPPRANRKPVLHLLDGRGTTQGYAKVAVNGLTARRMAREEKSLRALERRELGTLSHPNVISAGTWHSHPYLLISPVPTWSPRGIDPQVRDAALRQLVAAFDRTEDDLASASWWTALRNRVQQLDATPLADRLVELSRATEERWGSQGLQLGAAHGDWTPWNLATRGRTTFAWDWERFGTGVPLGLDALHYSFQSGVRLHGLKPAASLARLQADAADLVRDNGSPPTVGRMLVALYALDFAERFVRHQQEKAGAKKGPIEGWLLPALERVVHGDRGR